MIGANRVVLGNGIVHVVGDANVSADEEKKIRRELIEKALDALQRDGTEALREAEPDERPMSGRTC